MDPKIIVVVMGLTAFVVNKGQGFYVMIPNEKVIAEVVHPHRAHKAKLYSWDENKKKLISDDLKPFEVTLSGAPSFDPKYALILASSKSPFRSDCGPKDDLNKCTFTVKGKALPVVSAVGTIFGGRASMVAFVTRDHVTEWFRAEGGRHCWFVEPDLTPTTYQDQVTDEYKLSATLNDVFVVESDPVAIADRPPKVMVGGSPVTLGLAPAADCKKWTGRKEPCYPLLVTNAPPPMNYNSPKLPAHIHLAVVDYDVNVIYELLARNANDPRPLPIEIVTDHPGGSPYKCRGAGVVVEP